MLPSEWRAIVDDLRAAKMNTAADPVERSLSKTLTYYAFPTSTGRRPTAIRCPTRESTLKPCYEL